MDDVRYHSHPWAGLVRRDALPAVTGGDALARLLALPHTLVKDRLGVRTYRVAGPFGDAFLRHDTQPKRRWGRPSRAIHTLRIHRAMLAAGVTVPAPILALQSPDAELFLAAAVAGKNLKELLKQPVGEEQIAAWLKAAGQAAAGLHRCGFVHGDMIPGNMILREGDGQIVLIDNERTKRFQTPFFPFLRRRNLVQMVSRLIPRQTPRAIRVFLGAYDGSFPMGRGEWAWVLRRARKRRGVIDAERGDRVI